MESAQTALNEPPRTLEPSASAANPGRALAVALLGGFVITLDALVVNVALPAIDRDLSAGIGGLLWVVDSYTLMFAALLLFAGTLADRIGSRQTYGIGVVLFVAASAACALAPSLAVLILARFLQGAGAAVMMPASLAMIREAYTDPLKRARAIAIWAVGGAIASSAGPVVGGFLSLISWRMIFFINLPVGVLALVLLARVLPSPRRPVPFDWVGQITSVVAMSALMYGLIEGGVEGYGTPLVLLMLAVAAVALVAFVLSQALGRHPMVPLRLFRSRSVVLSLLVGFVFMIGFYGLVFLFSLYFQNLRGLSPLGTGLAFLPMTAVTGFINPVSARIAERYGARVPIVAGLLFMALGELGLYLASSGAPVALLALLMVPVGVGGALAIPTMTALLLNTAPAELAGTASGVLNTCRQLGGALAVAVFGALVAQQEQFLTGMHTSLLIATVLLVVVALACLSLRTPGRQAA